MPAETVESEIKRREDRARKQRENLARLAAQGTRRRPLATAATTAPGFGGHGDRGSGEDSVDADSVVRTRPLIRDPDIRRDLGISKMTTHRWDRDPRMMAIGWPPPVYIGRYKFRDSVQYAKFKARLAREAIARREALLKEQGERPSA
jgi:hypothetical protein